MSRTKKSLLEVGVHTGDPDMSDVVLQAHADILGEYYYKGIDHGLVIKELIKLESLNLLQRPPYIPYKLGKKGERLDNSQGYLAGLLAAFNIAYEKGSIDDTLPNLQPHLGAFVLREVVHPDDPYIHDLSSRIVNSKLSGMLPSQLPFVVINNDQIH